MPKNGFRKLKKEDLCRLCFLPVQIQGSRLAWHAACSNRALSDVWLDTHKKIEVLIPHPEHPLLSALLDRQGFLFSHSTPEGNVYVGALAVTRLRDRAAKYLSPELVGQILFPS